jgi:hypothetical protein
MGLNQHYKAWFKRIALLKEEVIEFYNVSFFNQLKQTDRFLYHLNGVELMHHPT